MFYLKTPIKTFYVSIFSLVFSNYTFTSLQSCTNTHVTERYSFELIQKDYVNKVLKRSRPRQRATNQHVGGISRMDKPLFEKRVDHFSLLERPITDPKLLRKTVVVLKCLVKFQTLVVTCSGLISFCLPGQSKGSCHNFSSDVLLFVTGSSVYLRRHSRF